MSQASAQLQQYETNATVLRTAIAGLSHAQLSAHPVPGTWSIGQIVTHLVDCEMVWSCRVKWILAEENPPLPNLDENQWMAALDVETRTPEDAAVLFELTRRHTAAILATKSPEAFARTGVHSKDGRISILDILTKANWHLEHHLKFLKQKRSMV